MTRRGRRLLVHLQGGESGAGFGRLLFPDDLAHLISHMATTLQRVSLKAEMSSQYASAIGAQRLLYDLLVSRRLDADAKKAQRNGWGYRRGNTRS